jgi:hypothetical protein
MTANNYLALGLVPLSVKISPPAKTTAAQQLTSQTILDEIPLLS